MKRQTVQKTLFFSYFIPILLTVLLLSVTFFVYTSRVLRKVEESNLAEITDKMVSIIDSEIKNMNNISLNITSSDLLKQNIEEMQSLLKQGYSLKSTEIYLAARNISSMFAMIAGPIKAVPQINYIIPGEFLIGSGTYTHIHEIPEQTTAALVGIDEVYGKRHFSTSLQDPLAENAFPRYRDKKYISLFRTVFNDQKKEPVGIIEVKQFSETIFFGPSKVPRQFMVFDSDYNQLFPATGSSAGAYTEMLKNNPLVGMVTFRNPVTREAELISIGKCREIDWTVLNIAQEKQILKPVYRFLLILITSGFIMFFISISVARRLSGLITQSLIQLNGWITNLRWDNLSAETPSDLDVLSPLAEFEDIHQEFWKMNKKLADSMKLVVQERTLQENARMLALQSQMDPHFMYNMLTTISIMAEDGETENIVETINRLTSILRYTASRSKLYVPLSEEKKITEQYLECMKIRFRDDLQFSIDIDINLQNLEIPKLIILPFVENSIKYATGGEPPWNIRISATVSGNRWQLIIGDSGPGFSAEALEKISKMISCCDEDAQNQLNFNFGGLGIPNIYSRLKIYFNDDIEFRMYNNSGAFILIGGPIWKAD